MSAAIEWSAQLTVRERAVATGQVAPVFRRVPDTLVVRAGLGFLIIRVSESIHQVEELLTVEQQATSKLPAVLWIARGLVRQFPCAAEIS